MSGSSTSTLLKWALALTLALGFADALLLALSYWPNRTFDGSTSGVWTTLAIDLSNGIFYRPVLADDAYGGTRYMPVFFSLHAAVIAVFGDPTTSGLVLMQASVVVMVAAIVRLLVQTGVALGWALAVGMLTYVTSIYQQYLTDVNSDYLAAALSLWGLTFFVGRDLSRTRLTPQVRIGEWIGTALFIAAFYTKFSTVYAPAAIFLAFVLNGHWQRAFRFSLVSGTLLIVSAFSLHWLSDGRMLAALSATAVAGTDAAFALGFAQRFIAEISLYHPAIGVCFLLGLMKWALDAPRHWREPLHLAFVTTTLVTIVVFSSRGIAGNHTIPLNAVSLVMIGLALAGTKRQQRAVLGAVTALGVIVVATWFPGVPSVRKTIAEHDHPTIAEIRATVARYVPADGVWFSENPLFPIAAGQRPLVLDAFSVQNLIAAGHPVGHHVKRRIETREFDAVIVLHPDRVYRLGEEQTPFAFSDQYEVVEPIGRYELMVRKPAS